MAIPLQIARVHDPGTAATTADAHASGRWCSGASGCALDAQLAACAQQQAPLRRVLMRLAARLIGTRGWERLGFARLGDWARERTGLSARQVYDLSHADAALAGLPRVEAAFLAGSLSWSKARLVCRVATPGNEARWVEYARRVPVRVLEREVRAVDRSALEAGALLAENDEDGRPLWPQRTIEIRCTPSVRARWFHAQAAARRVSGEKLPAWACMEAVAAEVLSALPCAVDPLAGPAWAEDVGEALERAAPGKAGVAAELPEDVCAGGARAFYRVPDPLPPLGAPDHVGDAHVGARALRHVADPLPPHLLALVTGLDETDAFDLDHRFRLAVALEQGIWSQVGALLARAAAERLHVALGCRSLEDYARERLGISPRKARALLRLERAAMRCPALRAAYREGRLSWVQAQALTPLVLLDPAGALPAGWVAHAERVSVRRLEDDVERAVAVGELAPPATGGERQTCAEPTSPGEDPSPAARQVETARFFLTCPRDAALVIEAAICTVRRHLERRTGRLPSRGEAVDTMFEHALETWGWPERKVAPENRVYARDGWRCTVPGCSAYRNLHDHHVVFRSAGGSDELSNRTTLCAWHHLRGVHAGTIRCAGQAPDALVFELGVRDPRPPLARYRSGDLLTC